MMRRDWHIGVVDAGLSEDDLLRHQMEGIAPEDFVAWFAEKYELIHFES